MILFSGKRALPSRPFGRVGLVKLLHVGKCLFAIDQDCRWITKIKVKKKEKRKGGKSTGGEEEKRQEGERAASGYYTVGSSGTMS